MYDFLLNVVKIIGFVVIYYVLAYILLSMINLLCLTRELKELKRKDFEIGLIIFEAAQKCSNESVEKLLEEMRKENDTF